MIWFHVNRQGRARTVCPKSSTITAAHARFLIWKCRPCYLQIFILHSELQRSYVASLKTKTDLQKKKQKQICLPPPAKTHFFKLCAKTAFFQTFHNLEEQNGNKGSREAQSQKGIVAPLMTSRSADVFFFMGIKGKKMGFASCRPLKKGNCGGAVPWSGPG